MTLVRVVTLVNPNILLVRVIVRLILLQREVPSGTIVVVVIGILDVVAESTLVGEHILVRGLLHVNGEIAIIAYSTVVSQASRSSCVHQSHTFSLLVRRVVIDEAVYTEETAVVSSARVVLSPLQGGSIVPGARGEGVHEAAGCILLVGIVHLVAPMAKAVAVSNEDGGVIVYSVELLQGSRSLLLGIVVDQLRRQTRINCIAAEETADDARHSTNHRTNDGNSLAQ